MFKYVLLHALSNVYQSMSRFSVANKEFIQGRIVTESEADSNTCEIPREYANSNGPEAKSEAISTHSDAVWIELATPWQSIHQATKSRIQILARNAASRRPIG